MVNVSEFVQQPGQKERLLKEAIFESLHVALPGQVVTYNPASRTATIQPTIRKWKSNETPPLLMDVPVFFPGGITFTVSAGDECLVVFSDVCFDSWFINGGVSTPASARMHDLSDGFAFVGFKSRKNITESINLTEKLAELEQRIATLEEGST